MKRSWKQNIKLGFYTVVLVLFIICCFYELYIFITTTSMVKLVRSIVLVAMYTYSSNSVMRSIGRLL